jgi:Ankyrin repeats (3 copies)
MMIKFMRIGAFLGLLAAILWIASGRAYVANTGDIRVGTLLTPIVILVGITLFFGGGCILGFVIYMFVEKPSTRRYQVIILVLFVLPSYLYYRTKMLPEQWTSELIEASERGDLALINSLIRKGADLQGTASNRSALYAAMMRGQWSAAKLLVEKGSAVNIVFSDGSTPLARALSADHYEFIAFLFQHGADACLKTDKKSYIPIMMEAMKKRIDSKSYSLIHNAVVAQSCPLYP